jgi:hypothetical protein
MHLKKKSCILAGHFECYPNGIADMAPSEERCDRNIVSCQAQVGLQNEKGNGAQSSIIS